MNNSPAYIVVVGASAGGLNSLIELSAQLSDDMNIAVLAVLHIAQLSMPGALIQRIQKNSDFICKVAEEGETIKANHFYLAVPDKHLIVKEGRIRLGDGTAENRWRPSVDVLFRSAAANYDGRTIGIILTGMLNDGTAGMYAIKQCGGTTIVQDPSEAEYPDMPLSVLNNMEVDFCTPLSGMGAILLEKSRMSIDDPKPIPEEIRKEAQIAERVSIRLDDVSKLGEKSLYSCPDCSGGLWEIYEGGMTRYRCHTGHAYTQDELVLKQSEALENTLWVALRMLEERRSLLDKMAKEETSKGWIRMAVQKKKRADELEQHIELIKSILFRTKDKISSTG